MPKILMQLFHDHEWCEMAEGDVLLRLLNSHGSAGERFELQYTVRRHILQLIHLASVHSPGLSLAPSSGPSLEGCVDSIRL